MLVSGEKLNKEVEKKINSYFLILLELEQIHEYEAQFNDLIKLFYKQKVYGTQLKSKHTAKTF